MQQINEKEKININKKRVNDGDDDCDDYSHDEDPKTSEETGEKSSNSDEIITLYDIIKFGVQVQ